MKIVIYKFKNNPWQMTRVGHGGSYFFTTSRSPAKFRDGRTARGFARSASKFAREKLGWKECIFDAVDYDDFKLLGP